jgi:hypothetical protein
MQRLATLLRRIGVFSTWGSVARVAAWVVVAALVLGRVLPSHATVYTDRPIPADEPASAVRYVAPFDKGDEDGFLAPPHDPNSYTVAWIGGSEVKWQSVSVPARFASRVSAVGGEPVVIDAYSMLAMRSIDALTALHAAIDNGSDAIVVAVNPSWFFPEWSEQAWQALDVAYPGTLWRDPSTWGWAPFIASPGDLLLALAGSAMPLVDNRAGARDDVDGVFDATDVLLHPPVDPAGTAPPTTLKGLPTDTSDFWMLHERGRASQTSFSARFTVFLQGLEGADHSAGDDAVRQLLDVAADAGRPVFFYFTPVSFDVLDDPVDEPLVASLEARLAAIAGGATRPSVTVQADSLSREMEPGDVFLDVVHMNDPGPLLDLLTPLLCDQWKRVAGAECRAAGGAP